MLFEKNPSVFLVEKHFQFYFSFLILSVLSMEYSQTRQIKRIYIVGTNLIKFHLQQNKQEKLDKVPVSEAHKFFLTIYMYIYFNKSVQAWLQFPPPIKLTAMI
jgi:cytochrome b561